jgi:DNA-binding CsgD family transcriptional regulator
MRFADRSSRTLLDFLAAVYASRDLDQFASRITSEIPKVIRCDIASYNEYDVAAGTFRYVAEPQEFDLPGLREAFGRHMDEHPFVSYYERTGSDRAVRLSDFLSQRRFHGLGLYDEFYRRVDTEYLLGLRYAVRLSLNLAVGLCRRSRDFTEHDRQTLEVLGPHLAEAYRNAEIREELSRTRRALESLDRGLLSIDANGKIRMLTTRAARLLGDYFGPRSDTPPELVGQWASERQPPESVRGPLVVERDGRRLVVRLLENENERLLLLEEQWTRVPAESLAALGLSRRESQVLAWVAEGKSDEVIAGILGVSFRTVKKHLEHVYAKLGVESRTAAAARAHRAVPANH